MRKRLERWFREALSGLCPMEAVRRAARREGSLLRISDISIDLDSVRRVFAIAFGKASRRMAEAVLPLLQGVELRGLLVPPAPDRAPLPPLEVVPGGHPFPDEGSLRAANLALSLAGEAGEKDLVLFLVSGGGSSLLEAPACDGLGPDGLRALHEALVGSGLDIAAINALRKRRSAVKGGRLAERAAPARQITLLVSDVPADRPDAVASGPTMPDRSPRSDLLRALSFARARLPEDLCRVLEGLPELPEPTGAAFARASFVTVLDSDCAIDLLAAAAERNGARAERIPAPARDPSIGEAAGSLLSRLERLRATVPSGPAAVVTGGELSVPLPARHGIGGRNAQFALALSLAIEGRGIAALSAGTDGIDGGWNGAGAVVDGTTAARARAAGLDPARHLAAFDAAPLFEALGDAVVTGPTGTNVRDLRILVHE
ncbi:MAG: glycerate kinase [Planctomycetota bacterium]